MCTRIIACPPLSVCEETGSHAACYKTGVPRLHCRDSLTVFSTFLYSCHNGSQHLQYVQQHEARPTQRLTCANAHQRPEFMQCSRLDPSKQTSRPCEISLIKLLPNVLISICHGVKMRYVCLGRQIAGQGRAGSSPQMNG